MSTKHTPLIRLRHLTKIELSGPPATPRPSVHRCAVCRLPMGPWHRHSSCPAAKAIALELAEYVMQIKAENET